MSKPIKAKWCPEARAYALDGEVWPDADAAPALCVYWDGRKCTKMLRASCKSDEVPTLTEQEG